MILAIGPNRYSVQSLAEASALYADKRDKSGSAQSKFKNGVIRDGLKVLAHVSYNGKVWANAPKDWKPGFKPLFDPYA